MRRLNYRDREVLYPLGLLLLAAALAAFAVAPSRWLLFLCGVAVLGLIDDALGASGPRGLRGHGRAVAGGELSTGAVKAVGTAALAAYAAATGASGPELVAAAGALALSAHAGNLLDTRPGRPEKALALTAAAICLASWSVAPLEPVAPVLPAIAVCSCLTLRERAMLGDSGASLVGAAIGVLLVAATGGAATYAVLAALAAVAIYGEFRSISSAIDRVPLLERLDSLGRAN
jgi:UDP-GlcNAc:undecaprenyl-phosphate/decaprenyl-phosphate GlcNAc-1-phosphate transferase